MQTFSVENYKGCRRVELSPEGSLVVIAGANGAGKSSFIDAFVELFDPKGTRLTPKPIREGATKARAEFVDTDLDVRIVRTWTKDDAGKLEVTALDGAKYAKPADVVARLTGGLIFDPVAFLRMDEKSQRQALLEKVELPFDLAALDATRREIAERRTEAGREVKRLEGLFRSMEIPTPGTPAVEVSAQGLLEEIQAAQDAERLHADREEAVRRVQARVEEITRQIADLTQDLEAATAEAERASADLAAAPVLDVDVDALREKLTDVEDTNRRVRARQAYDSAQQQFEAAVAAHGKVEGELADVDETKRRGLDDVSFPIDGLSVSDDGITYQGVPFSQVNAAAQRKVAFAVATAAEPDLRLVIVKDGDLLDEDSLKGIADLADERGYTVLVERDRDTSRQIGFTIVDGALEGDAAPALESRVQADMGCATCRASQGMGPFHQASSGCQSGGRNHCSCEICF